MNRGARRNVDDAQRGVRLGVTDGESHQPCRQHDVQRVKAHQVLRAEALHRRRITGRTGVVHHADTRPLLLVEHRRQLALEDLCRFTDVGKILADLPEVGILKHRAAPCDADDLPAFLQQLPRHSGANTRARAGNDRDPVAHGA